MATCFVIQPFDKAGFDKRYEQVFVPAIVAAGLEPYRVDRDPSSSVPISSIESGIRDASVCLADITTDNPNVWYELGYAFASGASVVMVCKAGRDGRNYPFDIQHRNVNSYLLEAPDDFTHLASGITERIRAELKKGATVERLKASSPAVAPVDGLSANEMSVLALLGDNISSPSGGQGVWETQQQAEKAGLTKLGCNLALHTLKDKHLIAIRDAEDHNGERYDELYIREQGWNWIVANEHRFELQRKSRYGTAKTDYADQGITDEDIPF